MKKILTLSITLFIIAGLNTVQAQKKAKWNEMEEFHKVMSTTFHPAEDGNLEPIKTRSGEMLDKAVAWKNSTPPDGYNKKEMMPLLKDLVKGAKKLSKMVKSNASDKEITDKLSSLHDVFHELMEK
jgi:hypothetical protein